jgi:hypothetical protein
VVRGNSRPSRLLCGCADVTDLHRLPGFCKDKRDDLVQWD